VWWCRPVVPATWEVEARGLLESRIFQANLGNIGYHISKIKEKIIVAAGHQCLMPVILATQEGGSRLEASLGK
jgi:hypothetical protein